MPVSASDFVAAAETLCHGESEIDWRNAISRAYYGAFHHASAHVQMCHEIPHGVEPGGSHERVILRYKHNGGNETKVIAYILSDLKTRRKTADYRLGSDCSFGEAVSQIAKARKVIEKVSLHFQSDSSSCP